MAFDDENQFAISIVSLNATLWPWEYYWCKL